MPAGLCAPSRTVAGSSSTIWKRPGTSVAPRPSRDGVVVELAEVGLGRGAREREVAPLEGALRRAAASPLSRGRDDEPRAALGAHALGERQRVRVQVGADHERRRPGARRRASRAAMSAIVGPSQRVCSSPTFVSTCTFDGITFVAS